MFQYSKTPSQNKRFVCKHRAVSLSLTHTHTLSLSLYFYDLLSKFANSLDTEDRPTCLIRGKQAYQELKSSPTLRPMITEHFRQVPSLRCMPWADPERGTGGPDPPEKSQKYRISEQYWSGSPKNRKATKPAFNGGPLARQQNAISKAFRWWADGGPFLVAFRSSLTSPSDKMFWIRACMQCVFTGSIEIKLDGHNLWYFGTYNVRQKLGPACASLHSQFNIDGSGMSSITAFMLNGLILCLATQTTLGKRPFCI